MNYIVIDKNVVEVTSYEFDNMWNRVMPEVTIHGRLIGHVSKNPIHGIEKVIYNDPATIVFWNDGSNTVVKCQGGDAYDPQTGLLMCIAKKHRQIQRRACEASAGEKAGDVFDRDKGFSWEDFANRRIAVNCRSLEDMKEFLKKANDRGFFWMGGSYERFACLVWGRHGEDACIAVERANGRSLGYCYTEWYDELGIEVVKYK